MNIISGVLLVLLVGAVESVSEPEPLQCSNLKLDNGKVITTKISLSCKEGWLLDGSSTQTCGSGGRWSDDLPKCKQIDPCDKKPCRNGGTCSSSGAVFSCACPALFTGKTCGTEIDPCDEKPCRNGGTCSSSGAVFSCACPALFTGKKCGTEIDPCDETPCQNGGTCSSNKGVFSCACLTLFTGNRCETEIDPCDETPCQNGGTCSSNNGVFSCACPALFTGNTCETGVVVCPNIILKNGSTTFSSAPNFVGSTVTFKCNDGFKRDGSSWGLCESGGAWDTKIPFCNPLTEIDPCAEAPCRNGGTCSSNNGVFSCACTAVFTGDRCETGVVCCPNILLENGIASFSNNPKIVGSKIYFECDAGFKRVGSSWGLCESGGEWDTETPECKTLTEIDPCDETPCQNGGTCSSNHGVFSCACPLLFTGNTCETGVVCCPNIILKNGIAKFSSNPKFVGSTVDFQCNAGFKLIGSSWGSCQSGGEWNHETPFCKQSGPCEPNPCLNGGRCIVRRKKNKFRCICSGGFTGWKCQRGVPIPEPEGVFD